MGLQWGRRARQRHGPPCRVGEVLPLLFEIRGWGMPTHEFFIAIGLAVATAVYFWEARRKGLLNEQTAWIAVGALVGGAILAKVGSAERTQIYGEIGLEYGNEAAHAKITGMASQAQA